MLTRRLKKILAKYSVDRSPEEACGCIIQKDEFIDFHPCQNIEQDKINFFTIDPKDYYLASKYGKVIAIFHSHKNNPLFSELDKENSNNYNLPFVLYCIDYKIFNTYLPHSEINKYLGREFHIGINDCFSLAKEYYRDNLGIEFHNYKRSYGWYRDDSMLMESNIENENFLIVQQNPIDIKLMKKHDLILFGKTNEPCSHIGIYLGDGTFLHHGYNQLSQILIYEESYRKITKYIVRHQLCFQNT